MWVFKRIPTLCSFEHPKHMFNMLNKTIKHNSTGRKIANLGVSYVYGNRDMVCRELKEHEYF